MGHTHSIEINNNNGLLYVCDLGDDVMKVFEEKDGEVAEMKRFRTGSTDSDYDFHGPRYTVFSNCGKFAYVVNEISNSVCALKVSESGDLSIIQTISSLPENFFQFQTEVMTPSLPSKSIYPTEAWKNLSSL